MNLFPHVLITVRLLLGAPVIETHDFGGLFDCEAARFQIMQNPNPPLTYCALKGRTI